MINQLAMHFVIDLIYGYIDKREEFDQLIFVDNLKYDNYEINYIENLFHDKHKYYFPKYKIPSIGGRIICDSFLSVLPEFENLLKKISLSEGKQGCLFALFEEKIE